MENNTEKHSPLPWLTSGISEMRIVASAGYEIAYTGNSMLTTTQERIANAEFIVTACNNHTRLLKENTLLKEVNEAQIYTIEKLLKENGELKEQLQKAEQYKKRLGKLLKEHLAEIESIIKLLKDCCGNEVMNSLSKLNVGYEDKVIQIKQTLKDCGITA